MNEGFSKKEPPQFLHYSSWNGLGIRSVELTGSTSKAGVIVKWVENTLEEIQGDASWSRQADVVATLSGIWGKSYHNFSKFAAKDASPLDGGLPHDAAAFGVVTEIPSRGEPRACEEEKAREGHGANQHQQQTCQNKSLFVIA